MSLKLSDPDFGEMRPRITVIGVGGGGGNAVNNMIDGGLAGVDFVVANTDAQALSQSRAEKKIQMGANVTEGLGAGAKADVGRQAAEESAADLQAALEGSHMVFVAAGMGGGTGTGAAPVVARLAKEMGALTVGIVTKPFQFEAPKRMRMAEDGIAEFAQFVDTYIVIPNQNLFRIATERTTFKEAFEMADQVLFQGVRGVSDLMVKPGLINLDFADLRSVMTDMGAAMMGTGEASGENRAVEAAEAAISNPLLDDTSMQGAKGVLFNISGGMDMTLMEVDEAANRVRKEVDSEALLVTGATLDETMEGTIRVAVVAAGIPVEALTGQSTPTRHASPHTVYTASPASVDAQAVAQQNRRGEQAAPVPLSAPAGSGSPAPTPAEGERPPWRRGAVAAHGDRGAVTNTPARQGGDPFDHHHQTGEVEAPVAQGPAAAPATASDDTAPSGTERPEGVRTEAPERAQAIKRGPEAVAPRRADGDPSPASPGWSLAKGIERGIRRAGVFGGGSKPVGMTRAAATAAEQASEVSSGQARKAAPLSPHDRPHVAATDQEASAYDEAGEDDDQRSGQGGGEPDLFGGDRSDDPLEIPAFLRRQAN